MRQIHSPCFCVMTLLLLVGLNGCMGREHPFRLTPVPLPDHGESREADRGDSVAAKKKNSKRTKNEEDPPLPSSLVSPTDGAPERQSFETAKQIRPLTMSDSPDAFVPQSGRYAVPDGLTDQEAVALRQGLPAEEERGTVAMGDTLGDTSSTSAAMVAAVGAEPMDIDPAVAAAHSLTEMMDASPSANLAKTGSGSEAFNGGMPNPMAGLSEAPLQVEPVDYARAGPLATQSPDELPGASDSQFMTAAPATALSAILQSGTSNMTPGTPQHQASNEAMSVNDADRFGANPVTPVAGNLPASAATSVTPIPTAGTPNPSGTAGASVTPWALGGNGAFSTPQTPSNALTGCIPMTTVPGVANPVGTNGAQPANASTAKTAKSGRCNFRPGSTRAATIPITGAATPIPIASSTTMTTGQTVTASDATTEVQFTDPPKTGSAAAPTTSISLTPVNDRFFR